MHDILPPISVEDKFTFDHSARFSSESKHIRIFFPSPVFFSISVTHTHASPVMKLYRPVILACIYLTSSALCAMTELWLASHLLNVRSVRVPRVTVEL